MTKQIQEHQIDVSVETSHLPEQSEPERQLFAYTITLHNSGAVAARLLTRHWIITDGNGRVQEVRGKGVVGQQPHLQPGESHTYTSSCMLPTPVGVMQGSFQMQGDDGVLFDATVSPFRLCVPGALH